MSRVCIYCLETKPPSAFQGEDHVIPRAFGSFVNSLTLDCVCDECNGYFGRTIELATFRDSLEAVLRLFHKTKPAKDGVRELGRRRIVTTLGGDDPNWNGCYATWTEEDGELVVDLVPQVGFPRLDGAGWRFVTEQALRNSEEPLPTDVDRNRLLLISQSQEMSERLIAVLTRRGISFKERGPSGGPPPSVGGLAPTELRTRIDDEILRCMAKIAFNYLAWTQLKDDFVLLPTFNPIRAFIRYGTRAPYPLVSLSQKAILTDSAPTSGHIVTASWTSNSRNIVGQVSPFNALTYAVSLARDFEGGVRRPLRVGHHFDHSTGKITMLVNEPPNQGEHDGRSEEEEGTTGST